MKKTRKSKKRISKHTLNSNSYVKIPASLLEFKQNGVLSSNELSVCAFLLSVQSASEAVNGFKGVQVSRNRIALSCGVGTARTVGNIIKKLEGLGLIKIHHDLWNGKRQSNVYVISELLLDLSGGFFYVPRKIFKQGFSPKLLMVYFLLCHAQNYEYSRSWNSYNDMARRLRMNRADIIQLISRLEGAGYVSKKRRTVKQPGKGAYYVDNGYTVVWLFFFSEKNNGQPDFADRRISSSFLIFFRKARIKAKKYLSSLQYIKNLNLSKAVQDRCFEYRLSVALSRLEEIKAEQLRIPDTPELWRDIPYYDGHIKGFPF